MKISIDRFLFVLFLFGLIAITLIVAVIYGFAVHKYKVFPYDLVQNAMYSIAKARTDAHYLYPRRFDEAGVKLYDREAMAPGVTLLTSYWPETGWSPGARLIDADGTVLHHWTVRPDLIWPRSPHADHVAGRFNANDNYIHGAWLFPDGDILFNIEYLGLQRLDSCGRVVWKLPFRTHHSIQRDADGNFWVSGFRWLEEDSERARLFPGLVPPFGEDIALKISPRGDILKEISVLEALFNSGYQDGLWRYRMITGDMTHLNDVEPLEQRLAGKFPSFEAGDLLISMRYLSAIAVMDQSGRIKWYAEGIFNNQHDPDFAEDGRIYVFDNRVDGSHAGRYLGGSAIAAIDPSNDAVTQVYPVDASQTFHTEGGGKHQRLENGNRLVTEARAGRVFEIDPGGRIVWEWVQQPNDAEMVPEVLEGTRYNIPREQITGWPCGDADAG
jgi:hypothetical protein